MTRLFHGLLVLVLYQVVSATTAADIPNKYRLPQTIVPTNYKLELILTDDTLKSNNYTGSVSITLNIKEDNLKEIQLHAKGLEVTKDGVKLEQINGDPKSNLTVSVSDIDKDTDFFKVTLIATNATLVKTNEKADNGYVLTIPFTGHLSPKEMEGFYKSSYGDVKSPEFLAATQFESTYARRAFPCFDEPNLKATFDLTISYPKGYNALANTLPIAEPSGDPLQKVTFKTTPVMSTYLLAFVVSKFKCSDPGNATLPLTVCSRPDAIKTTEVAAGVPAKILPVMKDFTGFDYQDMGLGKLTQVALPDFEAGAMENWGLVTFR